MAILTSYLPLLDACHRRQGIVSPVVALGMRWLAARKPTPPKRPVLVHGDARNGNLIVSENGLEALLDVVEQLQGAPLVAHRYGCGGLRDDWLQD